MMNIGDPKQLAYLRDLPSGYLLDLLAENEEIDEATVRWVLQERCYTYEEIERKVNRRRNSRMPRRPTLWRLARWGSLLNALIISIFNITGFHLLLQSEDTARLPLLFLIVTCAGFGFFLGYKMTTHIYQGGVSHLFCGFPVPIGFVNLRTSEEQARTPASMIICMAVNAVVGVNFTVFPVILIYSLMTSPIS